VAEAGVIGVPDASWGQRIVAIVRLSDSTDSGRENIEDELRAHCRARLAGYKTPREIRLAADPLPRTASGKLRRGALRERT
jgi:acyl-coenzyme A synthetase/AMP-(fatty) acid ligase